MGKLLVILLLLANAVLPAAASEVTFWTWASGNAFNMENAVMDLFRAQRPDLVLSYDQKSGIRTGEALVVAVAGGAAPDLVTTHQEWHRDFAAKGAFLDLRPFIERDKFNLNIFPKEMMKFYTGPNGEITGLPYQFTTIVLGFNKARFNDQGLAYPTAQWVLEDFVRTARKLTVDRDGDGNTDFWGANVGVLPEYVWRWWGVDMMTADGMKCNLGDPRAIEAFDWLAGMLTRERIFHPYTGGLNLIPDWIAGKIGMALAWPHYLTAWGLELSDEWDVEELPVAPAGYKVARGATAGWAIPVGAKNPEAAWEVLKFLVSDEAQLQLLATGRGGASTRAIARHWSRVRTQGLGLKAPGSLRNVQALVNSYSYASIDTYPTGYSQILKDLLTPATRRILSGQSAAQAELPQLAANIEARVAAASQ